MMGYVAWVLEGLSFGVLIGIISLFLFVLSRYFKGMKKPPFWIYITGGFLLLAFHDILSTKFSADPSAVVPLLIVKVMSHLTVLLGVVELYKILRKSASGG